MDCLNYRSFKYKLFKFKTLFFSALNLNFIFFLLLFAEKFMSSRKMGKRMIFISSSWIEQISKSDLNFKFKIKGK